MPMRPKRVVFLSLISSLLLLSSSHSSFAYNKRDLDQTIDSYRLIGLAELHDEGIRGKGQVIVMIDTGGIDINHPYFKDAVVDGFCSSSRTCGTRYLKSGVDAGVLTGDLRNPNPHGMLVGSIAIGRPAGELPGGIAPDATLISIQNFDDDSNEGLLKALEWTLEAKKNHNIVAVVGAFASQNAAPRNDVNGCGGPELNKIRNAFSALNSANISLVFGSANNGNPTRSEYPACLSEAISVGAVDSKGKIENYSNVSSSTLLAPARILAATKNGGYYIGGGTSSAAPVVAGAIALLKQAKPDATAEEIRRALFSTPNIQDDVVWQALPTLHLPTALNALRSNKFIENKVSASSIFTREALYDEFKMKSALLAAEKATKELAENKGKISELSVRASVLSSQLDSANQLVKTLESDVSKLQMEVKKLKSKLKQLCIDKKSKGACNSK